MNKDKKKIPRLLCQGTIEMLKIPRNTSGLYNCKDANKFKDDACSSGCLGLGDCVQVCKRGAIVIGENALPIFDETKCNGCGDCVQVCPRHVIDMISEDAMVVVRCNRHGYGKDKVLLCKTSCLGCTICQKACPFDAIVIQDGLSVINREKCRNCGFCAEICPAALGYKKVIEQMFVRR